ncbi:hypothetical protein [Sulfitobacter profundi]|uniref:Uncharacterized protein n=1 Tax=Sulfitobacter profundi TaxID=2679961 RepID=A0ABW1YU67_9RHOB
MRRFALLPRRFGKAAAVRAALVEAKAAVRGDMDCLLPVEGRAPERRLCRDIVADLNLTRVTWASGEIGLRLYISGRLVLHETAPAALAGLAEQWLTAARLGMAWAVPGAADPVTPGNGYVTRPADLYGLARAALDLATRGGLNALARDTGAPVTDAEVAALVAQAPPYRPKPDPDEILRNLQGQIE